MWERDGRGAAADEDVGERGQRPMETQEEGNAMIRAAAERVYLYSLRGWNVDVTTTEVQRGNGVCSCDQTTDNDDDDDAAARIYIEYLQRTLDICALSLHLHEIHLPFFILTNDNSSPVSCCGT